MNQNNKTTPQLVYDELLKVSESAWYFAVNYAKTLHKTMGVQPFPAWNFLKIKIFDELDNNHRILLLKSRQMYVTWSVVIYHLWEAIYKGPGDILYISKREKDAFELIERTKFVYNSLPSWLKPKMTKDSMETISFGKLNSRIFSVPNNPNAVRTYAPRKIIWDEMPHTPYDNEIWDSVLPVIEEDGSFIGIGTPNGVNTKHAELFLNSTNNFKKVKLHYSEHPEKGEEWVRAIKPDYSEESWKREQELDLTSGTRLIYERFSNDNIIGTFPDYFESCRKFRSVDFGFHTPVCHWYIITEDMKIIAIAEWYGEDNTIEELGQAINRIDKELGITEEDIEMTYGDPAGNAITDEGYTAVEKLQKEIYGFKFNSRKSNILPGIDQVRTRIRNAAGVCNLLVYKTGDPHFDSKNDGGCPRVISDFRHYKRSEKSDMPVKDNISDHGMDTVRYFVIGIFGIGELSKYSYLPAKVSGF